MIIEPEIFCREVENLHAHHGFSMFDAVFQTCDNYGVDYSLVGPLVNRSIKEKIKKEAIKMNLLKQESYTLFSEM